MSTTVQWLVGVAAGLTALGVIWRKFLGPVVKGVAVLAEAAPVLLEIAAEYKPNGNGSLHDTLDRVDQKFDAHVANMGVLAANVGAHIDADAKAFAEIAEVGIAQTLTMETTLATASALKTETAEIAAAVKAKAEEAAAEVKVEAEKTADALPEKIAGALADSPPVARPDPAP